LVENGTIAADMTVGLIFSAFSGTSMEVWTPPEAFKGCPNKTSDGQQRSAVDASNLRSSSGSGVWILPDAPSCLWNTMINPMVGYGLRAVIWNQGESNMGDTFDRFSCIFQNMIAAWRARWGIGDFPFLATQIGDQGGRWPSYVASTRDAQLSITPGKGRTVNGGLVSAYDQGDHCGGGNCPGQTCVWRQHSGNNCSNGKCCTNPFGFFGVHSRFKQEIGRRMALMVAHTCNLSTVAVDWSGPTPLGAATRDKGATVQISWQTTAATTAGGAASVYMKPTRDCWECCGGGARDVFQVGTRRPLPDGNERFQTWTNASFDFDVASSVVTIKPVAPAPAGEPYVVVRYAASLWPQCAFHSSSNDVPAFSFSDLNISAAVMARTV
jgi:hypothetical protein